MKIFSAEDAQISALWTPALDGDELSDSTFALTQGREKKTDLGTYYPCRYSNPLLPARSQ
jgi:hypothetical protein